MKSPPQGYWPIAIAIIGFTISSLAAELPPPKLTGVVIVKNKKEALLELHDRSRSGSIMTRKPILHEGERDGVFEVMTIDEVTGTVRMRIDSEPAELRLEPPPEKKLPGRTLCFRSADLRQVMDVYQSLLDRTVISRVPVIEQFTLESDASLATADAVAFLEQGFATKGIGVKLAGTKFVFVDRADRLGELSPIPEPPQSAPLAPASGNKPGTSSPGMFSPGMLKFQDSDLLQVLDIYQDLTGRTILRPNHLRASKISLRSQTPLTRKEAIWLLEAALFAQSGVTTFPEGDKFVFVMPNDKKGGPPRIDSAPAPTNATGNFPAGVVKFQDATLDQFLQVYAALSGQEALPLAPQVPQVRFSIRNQKELSRSEALFALEAVAALNGLRFERLAGDKVQIVRAVQKTPQR